MDVESASGAPPTDLVIIDTNVWRSQLLLKTPTSNALVYALWKQKGRLGLPEVIELELPGQIAEAGREILDKQAGSFRKLETLVGDGVPQPYVDGVDWNELTCKRLVELERILVRMPFTLAHAKAALDMVIGKMPPNSKHNQQFKDSAIWQAILDLPNRYLVHLITEDKGFFEGDDSKSLASNLQDDCRRVGLAVKAYLDVGSCLKSITSEVPSFDQKRLASLIEAFVMARIRSETALKRFEIKEVLDVNMQAFRTDQENRIAVDFTCTNRFKATWKACDEDAECRAVTYGSCYYDPDSESILDPFIEEVRFVSRSPTTGYSAHARSFEVEDPSFPFRRDLPWE